MLSCNILSKYDNEIVFQWETAVHQVHVSMVPTAQVAAESCTCAPVCLASLGRAVKQVSLVQTHLISGTLDGKQKTTAQIRL